MSKTAGYALVLVDVQNDFCAAEGVVRRCFEDPKRVDEALERIHTLYQSASAARVPCFFLRSFFDTKYKLRSVLEKHRRLGIVSEVCREGSWGADLALAPREDDYVITKFTTDGFLYSYLEPLLRKEQVDRVIIAGFLTEVCVLDTAKGALQRGFSAMVVEDATAGLFSTCFEGAIQELRALQADVVRSSDVRTLWRLRSEIEPSQAGLFDPIGLPRARID